MKQIKLNVRGQSDHMLCQFARGHGRQADESPAVYTALSPDKEDYDALLTKYEAKLRKVTATEQAYKRAVIEKNQLRQAVEAALRSRAGRVCVIAGNDEAVIAGAGFKAAIARGARIGELPAPQHVKATMGAMRGHIDLKWKRPKGSKSEIVECRTRGAVPGPWQRVKFTARPKCSIHGLTSGQDFGFRVRSLGAAGEGPWSDEAVRMAP